MQASVSFPSILNMFFTDDIHLIVKDEKSCRKASKITRKNESDIHRCTQAAKVDANDVNILIFYSLM